MYDDFEKLSKTKYLYHYTSFETLFAILDNFRRNGTLIMRASNVYNVNDPSEMEKGYDVLKKHIRHYEDEKDIPESLRLSEVFDNEQYEKACKEDYLNGKDKDLISIGIIPYIMCFTMRRDFLPMWSLYGAKGKGVCIKMDASDLMKQPNVIKGFITYSDRYTEGGFWQSLSYMYNMYKRDFSRKVVTIGEKTRELATICIAVAPFVKHKDYQYEKEFRIVSYTPPIDNDVIILPLRKIKPYIEIPLSIESIKEIIIGPDANYEVMRYVLGNMLTECGLNSQMISRSKISFKNNNH